MMGMVKQKLTGTVMMPNQVSIMALLRPVMVSMKVHQTNQPHLIYVLISTIFSESSSYVFSASTYPENALPTKV